MSVHECLADGKPQGVLDGAAWASPGKAVRVKGEDRWGRVELLWRCCGALEVVFIDGEERVTEIFAEGGLSNPYADYPHNLWPDGYILPNRY